jgi:hypothetical protein
MLRIATMIGLVLALCALPAAAEHDRHERATKRNYDRATERDGRLAKLAHELERATHHVHERAGRSAHHRDWREVRALRALHRLDERVRHFHRQVEQGWSPAHTSNDFERVRSAFRDADARLHGLHANGHVQRDFDRVARIVRDLEWAYARRDHRAHDGRYAYRDSWRRPFWLGAMWWR